MVKGIGDYGNAFGVPTVGGEVYFDDCYKVNPLVNAMSVGIVKTGEIVSATSKGAVTRFILLVLQPVKMVYMARHFASEDITEDPR